MEFKAWKEVVKISNDKNLTNYEKAEKDYYAGIKYKDIAAKYNVSINTVKTWKRRYSWNDRNETKKVFSMQLLGNNFEDVKEDLLNQLKRNGVAGEYFIDLINTYMELFKIKNKLIQDIDERGVAIEWFNGKQTGVRKNDSISELNKTVAQMLSLLNDLGLKPSPGNGGGGVGDEEL